MRLTFTLFFDIRLVLTLNFERFLKCRYFLLSRKIFQGERRLLLGSGAGELGRYWFLLVLHITLSIWLSACAGYSEKEISAYHKFFLQLPDGRGRGERRLRAGAVEDGVREGGEPVRPGPSLGGLEEFRLLLPTEI